ncbi:Subtilisin-like protease SBT1.4-like protein [Drosera capensis]
MAPSSSSLPPLLFLFFLLLLPHSHSSPTTSSATRQTYIFHVAAAHKPAIFATHRHWYASLLRRVSVPSSSLLYTYSHASTGFAALLTPHQSSLLLRSYSPSIILSAVPDLPRRLHTTHTPHFLSLSPSSGLWPNSDYANDIIVGVLDTGIWPEHRSFSDSTGYGPVPSKWTGSCEIGPDFNSSSCNRKLIGARAYYRGYEAAIGGRMDPTAETRSPRDTEGHGTHTASTAAGEAVEGADLFGYAKGEARGMATKARVAIYKICWSLGCYDSDILAAFDRAVSDGVDVISLSVGANGYAPPYERDSIAIGAFGAVRKGIVVSCSAGNSGPGRFTAVNVAPWILTVGASTIDREFVGEVLLGDGRVFNGVSLYGNSAGEEKFGEELLDVVYAKDAGSRYCYEGWLDSSKVTGKLVICDRGGNARVEKGYAVKLAGGVAMILANTEDSGEELIADSHLIPATMVGQIAGDKIKEYVASDPKPTATINFRGTVIGSSPPAPRVAAFSSRGPNYRTPEILKPDVIAPGVNILAGWTGAVGPTDLDIDTRRVEFNIISGTSMSCPHVSGLAALLRKAYPDWSPAAVKSALMTTAHFLDNSGGSITDLATGDLSSSFVHGAGHVDPNAALDPGLVFDIDPSDYEAFLCSIGYDSSKMALFIRGPSGSDCSTRKLSSPGNLNYPALAVVFQSRNDTITYTRTVKNVGLAADVTYEVKVSAPADVEVTVSPSTLVFSADNKALSYEVTLTSIATAEYLIGATSFGAIEWTDGSHRVRSPIAVRWLRGAEHLVDSM